MDDWSTSIESATYVCLACRHAFADVGGVRDDGLAMARSEINAAIAIVDLTTAECGEARRLLGHVLANGVDDSLTGPLSPVARAVLNRVALEQSLDPAPDGSSWVLEAPPLCPRCGARDTVVADTPAASPIDPPRFARPAHELWLSATDASRQEELQYVVRSTIEGFQSHGIPSVARRPRWLHRWNEQPSPRWRHGASYAVADDV